MENNDNVISNARTIIMGFAALWIMLFHGTIEVPISSIRTLIKIGYLGVDIFMFMSGFSMCNSYEKSCGKKMFVFIKRRMMKILPTFIPFAVIWTIGYFLENYKNIDMLMIGIRTSNFWITMLTFRWFVPCIIICYFITPIIHKIFEKFGFNYLTLVVMIVPFLILGLMFNGSSMALMFLLRFPTYIVGYFYGKKIHKSYNIYLRILLCIIGYVVYYILLKKYEHVFLCDSGLYWYPAIILTSSMVVCLAYLAKLVKSKIIIWIGEFSFEVYLWHMYLLYPCLEIFKKMTVSFDKWGIIINLICIGLTLLISYVYAKIIKGMTRLITNRK